MASSQVIAFVVEPLGRLPLCFFFDSLLEPDGVIEYDRGTLTQTVGAAV